MTYFYDKSRGEYLESKKLNKAFGTSIPNTTPKEPLAPKLGFAVCFNETTAEWEYKEDNRGKALHDINTKQNLICDYLGALKDNHKLGDYVKTADEIAKEIQAKENQTNQSFLDGTDWKVTRHRDQVELGVTTSLTDAEFTQLLQDRQTARDSIVKITE